MKTSGLRLVPVDLKFEEAVIACCQGVRLVHVELGVKTPGLKSGPCGLEVRRRQVLKPVHVDWK